MIEKFLQKIHDSEKTLRTASHLTYVTFPLVRDKKLLLKIVTEIKSAIANCISSILQYEYLYKRISLYKSPRKNMEIFQMHCAKRYNITEQEIREIKELFDIVDKHRSSPMEIMKDEKVVILSENMQQKTISIEKTKDFLELAKKILQKTKNNLKEEI